MEHLEAKKRSGVQGLQKRGADSVLGKVFIIGNKNLSEVMDK